MESMAAFAWQALQAEGLSSAVVIGHSMGGYIALAFAEAYPDAVEGLGLFSSTARPDTEEKKKAAANPSASCNNTAWNLS